MFFFFFLNKDNTLPGKPAAGPTVALFFFNRSPSAKAEPPTTAASAFRGRGSAGPLLSRRQASPRNRHVGPAVAVEPGQPGASGVS